MRELLFRLRSRFEQKQISRDVLIKLYEKYNSLSDVNSFVDKALAQFPILNCGLVCVYLREILGGEIINGSYNGNPHTFLKLDGNIIDITADQYGGPKVYAGPLVKPWSV